VEDVMDAIEAIHGRRSVRSYEAKAVDHDLIESVISDAAQGPPPFRGMNPLAFNVIQGVQRIAAYGARAMDHARRYRPGEAHWDWLERPGFKIFWDAPALVIISGPVEGLPSRRSEPDAVGACAGSRNVLGRFADALARHTGGAGRTGHPFRTDTGRGVMPRLSRRGRDTARTAPDHLGR
jgi:nitroreductase